LLQRYFRCAKIANLLADKPAQLIFVRFVNISIFFPICSFPTDLSRCQRTLAKSLNEFNFECIGSTQTDDEQVIADSLKQFSKLISAIEDERDNMVRQFSHLLKEFRKFFGSFFSSTEPTTKSSFLSKVLGKMRLAALKRKKNNTTSELQNSAKRKKRF
jgi:BAR domain of APPL family